MTKSRLFSAVAMGAIFTFSLIAPMAQAGNPQIAEKAIRERNERNRGQGTTQRTERPARQSPPPQAAPQNRDRGDRNDRGGDRGGNRGGDRNPGQVGDRTPPQFGQDRTPRNNDRTPPQFGQDRNPGNPDRTPGTPNRDRGQNGQNQNGQNPPRQYGQNDGRRDDRPNGTVTRPYGQGGGNANRPNDRRDDRRDDRVDRRDDRRDDRYDRRDDRRDNRYDRRDDRRDDRADRRHDRDGWQSRHNYNYRSHRDFRTYTGIRVGFYFAPRYGYHRVPNEYYGYRYDYGDRLPRYFYSYRVYDPGFFYLPAKPFNCEYYFVGNDIVLVDMRTGIIIDVFYDVY